MLSAKKTSRDERRKLATKAPKRDGISRVSKYEKEQTRKKEEMVAASKKRKLEGKVKKNKKRKKQLQQNVADEISDDNSIDD